MTHSSKNGGNVKAIGLFSGGLDSTLAACVLMNQGVEVRGVSFRTPFFGAANAIKAAEQLGVELDVVDITDDHLRMVVDPPHGYGKNMNPCIDCHAMMFNRAGRMMEKTDADFLFSGEVLGERPMSQNRQALGIVANDSGYADLILRPLSAKLLEPTRMETEGLVDRERLMDINGRSRTRQMALAEHYGIRDYPTPAGGCRLTEPGFSRRLRELIDHQLPLVARDVELLTVGRHFRLGERTKAIVGRNKAENDRLVQLRTAEDTALYATAFKGPFALLTGLITEADVLTAAGICIRYSDAPEGIETPVTVEHADEKRAVVQRGFSTDQAQRSMI